MKALAFDSGPIISLAMNNLLWLLEPLKRAFGGPFYITPTVRHELVERPLKIKKFEYEAIQVAKLIDDGIVEVFTGTMTKRSEHLVKLANQCYSSKGRYIRIVHDAEIETLTLAGDFSDHMSVVDERTVRLLLENPEDLRTLLERRLHRSVQMTAKNVRFFQDELADVGIIRSSELVTSAFSLGLFDSLVPRLRNGREVLLDAVLWGVKSNGCAITTQEIEEIKEIILSKSL